MVKFVYLMAAYAWAEQGRLRIDEVLDRQLSPMIRAGSNPATQCVVRAPTDTEGGPELQLVAYTAFRERRLGVKRWLDSLGVTGIHSLHPTYDGGGDLYGRDRQLMRDASLSAGVTDGELVNRNAMSALGTAKLLALLAADRGLSPGSATEVCERMRRHPTHAARAGAPHCRRDPEYPGRGGLLPGWPLGTHRRRCRHHPLPEGAPVDTGHLHPKILSSFSVEAM